MTTYPNYWPGWEADVLAAAGLPKTPQNQAFLANWHSYEGSVATNNPLNTTAYAPIPATVGTGAINSAGVQNYPTPQQGAQANAAFLKMPNFASIFAALKSGDPYGYGAKSKSAASDIAHQLAKWGSTSFAVRWLYETPTPPAAETSVTQVTKNPDTGQSTTSTTKGPTIGGWVGDLTGWIGQSAGYASVYLLLVLLAVALALVGLLRLLGVHTSTVAKTVGAAA